MKLPDLPDVAEIRTRLERLFPPGLEMRNNLVREMAARTIFVFLYGGMLEGSNAFLRPSHIYFFTEWQALKSTLEERLQWLDHSRKPGFRPDGGRWYADTTREPIRDETIRLGLLHIGAVGKLPGFPVTSSRPIYFLKNDFAELFNPALEGTALDEAIVAWQKKHLTPAARARMTLLASGKLKLDDDVLVNCPDGTIAKLSPGPSSIISKGVVETFAPSFLRRPVLLWLSESREKVRYQDEQTAKALGLQIDQSKILPDIILADVGDSGDDTHLIFLEVVASDGPMNQARRDALSQYILEAEFPQKQCLFGTGFEDRSSPAFKKCLPELAWGTFVWFRSEPERLIWLHDEPFAITT